MGFTTYGIFGDAKKARRYHFYLLELYWTESLPLQLLLL